MSQDDKFQSSRRSVLQASLGVLAAGTLMASKRAAAQQKIAKEMVMYQETPKDGQQCSLCAQFDPPDACKVVEGKISPNGWCGAFAPKGA